MSFRERLKVLTSRAEKTAAEHKDEIRQAMGKAEAAVDQQTGGKYHDQIGKADAKAEGYLEGLDSKHAQTVQTADPDPAETAPAETRPKR